MRADQDNILTTDIIDLLSIVGQLSPVMGVVADNGGDTPRKASDIKYTVYWNTGGGTVLKLEGIVPNDERPPDLVDGQPLFTKPIKKGAVVFGAMFGQSVVFWSGVERGAFRTCGTPAPTINAPDILLKSGGLAQHSGLGGGVGGGGLPA